MASNARSPLPHDGGMGCEMTAGGPCCPRVDDAGSRVAKRQDARDCGWSRGVAVGSRAWCTPSSSASLSAGSSSKWSTSVFRIMRSRVTDLGITTRSCCSDQRINTYAGDTPCRRATAATTGSSRRWPRVSGLYTSSWMSRSRQTTTSLSETQPSGDACVFDLPSSSTVGKRTEPSSSSLGNAQ